tara:strand:- start:13526 stop:14350 length:825 start_codon:yes stop_codon:yes gene_type:complete
MSKKYAILGYNTINIGDDIQSVVTSTLLDISYIVNRDDYDLIYNYNTGELITNLKEKIYLIMNGWFMHNSNWKTGNDNIKFPIENNNIIPIYISTCLSKDVPLLYKNECIEHYKKNSPILCRDKTTFTLLKNNGVDVSLYGCLTQLLDIKNIPDNKSYEEKYKDSIIYVDCPNEWKERNTNEKNYYFHHYIDELMNMNPKQRINYAQDLLTKYKYAKKIYSHRLHAFLPCRAMGLDAEYVGDLNYRVVDLISTNPDKLKLNQTFLNYIESKSAF